MRIKKVSQYIEGGAGLPSYFTEEIDTGMKWIDGKPIYRKVLIGTTNTTGGQWASIGEPISNIREVVNLKGIIDQAIPVPNYVTSSYLSTIQYSSTYGVQVLTNGYTNLPVKVIIEYTKTTD